MDSELRRDATRIDWRDLQAAHLSTRSGQSVMRYSITPGVTLVTRPSRRGITEHEAQVERLLVAVMTSTGSQRGAVVQMQIEQNPGPLQKCNDFIFLQLLPEKEINANMQGAQQ